MATPTTTRTDKTYSGNSQIGVKKSFSRIKRFFKGSTSSSSSSRNSSKSSLVIGSFNKLNDDMPPLRPIIFHGYTERTRNRLMSSLVSDEIRTLLPARLEVTSDWHLLYSLEQHGASLNSLYRILKAQRDKKLYDKNGYVLVLKDATGNIFGAYVNEIFEPHELKRYYGNGECFLWSVEKVQTNEPSDDVQNIRFKGFPFTGVNDYIIYCQYDSISIGSSEGHNGIWIDKDLKYGVTQRCDTFGNDILSKEGEKFRIMGLEIWMI